MCVLRKRSKTQPPFAKNSEVGSEVLIVSHYSFFTRIVNSMNWECNWMLNSTASVDRIDKRNGASGDDIEAAAESAVAKDQSGRQRRCEERIPVRIRGLLYHGGNYQTTIIDNISPRGVGLVGAMGIVPGDNIAIQLLNGRELSGKVMWWLADRCGIAFHQPLAESDPLLKRRNP